MRFPHARRLPAPPPPVTATTDLHRPSEHHLHFGDADPTDGDGGRGLHSFPFQLNLSSSVHRITNGPHECVLELLKLSSNVNECKPLDGGGDEGLLAVGDGAGAAPTYAYDPAWVGRCRLTL